MSYCTFVFFGVFFGFSKCEQQSWLALLVNGIVYGSEVAEISGMDFKLKSCWSSSAMVDMEKVVSINSGDLLYRARPPNWSSFPDPADNLQRKAKMLEILIGIWFHLMSVHKVG